MSPRHVPASVTELSRIGLFASLPGETLRALAERMVREEVAPGTRVALDRERFYVVLTGLASVREPGGSTRVLRPGDSFTGADGIGATAMTPCVLASCDRATYDALVRPKSA